MVGFACIVKLQADVQLPPRPLRCALGGTTQVRWKAREQRRRTRAPPCANETVLVLPPESAAASTSSSCSAANMMDPHVTRSTASFLKQFSFVPSGAVPHSSSVLMEASLSPASERKTHATTVPPAKHKT